MDHSNNGMDQLLQAIDTSKVQGYQQFMHDLIVEGISHHCLHLETLNSFLFEFNKQIYDAVCEKGISYYDTYATEKIKSLGNWTCLGNDVTSLLFNQALRFPLTHIKMLVLSVSI